MTSKLAILLGVLAVVACSNEAKDTSAEYSAYLTSAETYFSQGQFQAAMIETSNAIQLEVNNQAAYQVMAKIYLRLGQPREAAQMLTQIEGPEENTLLLLAEANLDAAKYRSADDALKSLANPDAVAAQLLAARVFSGQGEYAPAVAIYEKVLAQDANVPKAVLGFAKVQLGAGKIEEAEVLLQRGVQIPEIKAESLFLLSAAATSRNEMAIAENYLNEAISALPSTDIITPLRYATLSSMKDNLSAQGKTDEAMIYSGLLVEALPGAQQATELLESALESIQAGDLDAARLTLSEVKEIAPTSPRAATLLATVDFLEGNNEAAALQLEQIVDPETSSDTELQIYALTQLRAGNAQLVVDRLSKDVDSIDNAKLMALYAVALGESGDPEQAEIHFRKAIELNPQDGRLHLPIAQIKMVMEEDELALQELDAAFKKSPDDAAVQRMLIGLYLSKEMTQEADKLVAGLDSSYPNAQATQLLVAGYYVQQGKTDLAEQKFKQVLEMGDSAFVRAQLAQIYLNSKRYPLAKEQYEKIIGLNSEDSDAYKGFITALELDDKKDQIEAELEKLFKQSPSNTLTLVWTEYLGRNGKLQQAQDVFSRYEGEYSEQAIGLFESIVLAVTRDHIANERIAEARSLMQSSIADLPQSERLITSLVTLDIKDGKFETASKAIENLKTFSERPVIDVLVGDLASAKGEFVAAKDAYLKVWNITKSDQAGLKVFRAMELARLGQDEMSGYLADWVEQSENPVVPLMVRAGYWLGLQDMEKAQNDYLQVVEMNPENITAYNNLAWAYGEDNPQEALVAGKQAFELDSNNPQVMDTYGWFLFKNGQREEAVEVLTKALEMLPNDAEIRGHLEEASGG